MATVKAVTLYKLENENEKPRCLGRLPYSGDPHLKGFRAFLEGLSDNPIVSWPFDFWDSQLMTTIATELEQHNTLELHDHVVTVIQSLGGQSTAGKDIMVILEPTTEEDASQFIPSLSMRGAVACAPMSSLREDDSQEEPSCPTLEPRHKIFLSHSGAQKNFVAKLCKHLEAHNHYPFFDQRSDSLPKGKKFSTLIIDAARKCHVAVVVLSKEYLCSKWPMLELAEFVRARRSENKNLNLFPLFYKASVGDLSNESIKNMWRPQWMNLVAGDARVNLEDWTRAVQELRGINGLSFDKFGNSKESYRDAIVKEIFMLSPPNLLYDTSKIFGWRRICEILAGILLLHTKTSAQVLGLYGMGGLGKTTMSKSLCNFFNEEFLGRVCYIEINEGSTARERQQMVMRKLLRLDNLLLQSVSEVSQGWNILQTRMKEHSVCLVIDNVQPDEESKEEALEYLRVKYRSGSKIIVTSRSSEVVEDLLGDPRYCHEIPCLTREEAAGVFLQQGAPQMDYSSLTSDESRVVESCLEEAWFSQGSQEQVDFYDGKVPRLYRSKAGHFHPLALRALGAYFRGRSKTSDLLSWNTYLHEYPQLKGTGESYRRMFKILGLQFNTLDRMAQLMFLDITHYGSKALETPMLSNSQLEDLVVWLANINGVATKVARSTILDFKRFAMINIDGERIVVHDLYKEYATWFLEQVNCKEVLGVWCVSKHGEPTSSKSPLKLQQSPPRRCLLERLIELRRTKLENIYCELLLQVRQTLSERCFELERTPPGRCWPELRRIRLENIRCVSFAMEKVQEWCNVVVLQIDGCNNLTTLDLQGLHCLRHLELKRLRSLETLILTQDGSSSTSGRSQGTHTKPRQYSLLPSLQYVTIASLDSLECLPSFSTFTSLKFLKVVDCKGLIQPPCVQHCSSLERMWLSWYPRQEFLPDLDGLTFLRDLTIERGCDISSYEGKALKLEGLSSLASLGALELRSIPMEDLSGLENLTRLEYVHLDDMRFLIGLASLHNLARSSLIVLEVWGFNSNRPEDLDELDELQFQIELKLEGLAAAGEVNVLHTPSKILEWHRRDMFEHPVINAIRNRSTTAVPHYRGVRYLEEVNGYVANFRPPSCSKKISLGTYGTAEEAARAFDIANLRRKKKLPLNFPDSPKLLKEISSQPSPKESWSAIAKLAKDAARLHRTNSSIDDASSSVMSRPNDLTGIPFYQMYARFGTDTQKCIDSMSQAWPWLCYPSGGEVMATLYLQGGLQGGKDVSDHRGEPFLSQGFRFHPTDEELVSYYLTKKVLDSSFAVHAIPEVDLNKYEPWDLPQKARNGGDEWYFFSLRNRKYPGSMHMNRATEAGYWKATGRDRDVVMQAHLVGMKRTLIFYRGRAPRGEKTIWIMHEYRLEGDGHSWPSRASKDEWVVCRVFRKRRWRREAEFSVLWSPGVPGRHGVPARGCKDVSAVHGEQSAQPDRHRWQGLPRLRRHGPDCVIGPALEMFSSNCINVGCRCPK